MMLGAQTGVDVQACRQELEMDALRVLIVDDYVDMAEAMQVYLTHSGYEVRTAYSGGEAISTAEWFTPDLAIVDIRLPDMSGYELALKLRDGDRSLRLLALSSCLAPDYYLAERFDEVARKPISGKELRRILRRLRPR